MEMTKTAMEKQGKAIEMARIYEALANAGIAVERVLDNGTLAYMITEGNLEGRFITIKVVLTKEHDEETGKGFDMEDAIQIYEEKVAKETEREAARIKRDAEQLAKKAKAPVKNEVQ